MSANATATLRQTLNRAFYANNRLIIALCIGVRIAHAVVGMAIAFLLQQLIDAAVTGEIAQLNRMALLTAGIIAADLVTLLLQRAAQPRMLERTSRQYKNSVFDLMTRKRLTTFNQESSSSYLSALTNDVTAIENGWLTGMTDLAYYLLTFVGSIALMLWYSPLLTAISIGLSLLPLVASLLTGGVLAKREKEVSDGNEHFLALVKDMLSGFPVIKSFQAEEPVRKLFQKENAAVEETKRRRRRTAGSIDVLTSAAGMLCQLGVFVVAGYMAVMDMGVTVGMITAFIQMTGYFLNSIAAVPQIVASYRAKNALVEKLSEALAENGEREGERIAPELRENIHLSDVTFGYDPEKSVLRHVSCEIKAGSCCAVVGASGSGKSTMLNLLMGGYDGYEGDILLDGRELRSLSPDSLQAMMSLVQQHVFVFNDTLRRNITMFQDFPEGEVQSAVERSGLTEVVRQKGMDYVCGENGCGLSGGEKQRISIARSLLRRSSVLLMDEATAALDNQTAKEVTEAVLNLQGMTRVVVTHRLQDAALKRYDQILVMRNGEICERGTFEALMASKGYFYSLFTVAQSGEDAA